MPEYVVIFFIVIGALVAMTVFVQRGFQARVRDGRTYAANMLAEGCRQAQAASTGDWPVDCAGAASIPTNGAVYEYEPYYGQINTQIAQNHSDTQNLSGNVFSKQLVEQTNGVSTSVQLPPEEAN